MNPLVQLSNCGCNGAPISNDNASSLCALIFDGGVALGASNCYMNFMLEPLIYCAGNWKDRKQFEDIALALKLISSQVPGEGGREGEGAQMGRLQMVAQELEGRVRRGEMLPLLLAGIDCNGPQIFSVQICGIHRMRRCAAMGLAVVSVLGKLDSWRAPPPQTPQSSQSSQSSLDAANEAKMAVYQSLSCVNSFIEVIVVQSPAQSQFHSLCGAADEAPRDSCRDPLKQLGT